jgi:hypothetical protein
VYCADGTPELVELFKRYGKEHSEWTFRKGDVRPYGILLTEAETLDAIYGKQTGQWKKK